MYRIRTFEDVTIATCENASNAAMVALGVANIQQDDVWIWAEGKTVEGSDQLTMVMPSSDSRESDGAAYRCLLRELNANESHHETGVNA